MPAGSVLGVVLIALTVAALFNSEAIVRAGESMQPGHTRDIVLSVGRPLDDVAGAVGFHLPARGIRPRLRAGEQDGRGHRARAGLDRDPAPQARSARSRRSAQPTRQDEVDVFVTGDSQAQFVGEVLTDMLPSDLFDVCRGRAQRDRPDQPRVLQLGDQRAPGDRRPQARRRRDGHGRQRRLQRAARRHALRPRRPASGRPSTPAARPS